MDIHRALSDFMVQGKDLLYRLRSPEGGALSESELQDLRLCLHLLDIETSNRHHLTITRPKEPSAGHSRKGGSQFSGHADSRPQSR